MGRLIAAFDWSRTAVGAISDWSTSLRTTLGILVRSRHPMFLWWGDDLVQFYNDGYRPSLGLDRHPAALGARGREFWVDIWRAIGPQIEAVMTQGESTWHHDHLVPIIRNGRLEDVFWTYGYSPVHDDDGSVGGTLVVVQEQTKRVVGERRLRLLRDLAASASAARTTPDAWTSAAGVFAMHRGDVPWAVFFAVDGSPAAFVPAAHTLEGVGETSHGRGLDPAAWPLSDALLAGRLTRLADSNDGVVLVPVRGPRSISPYGVIVAAVSARQPFDADYEDFLLLAADQVAAGVTNARVHEDERQRAAALVELDRAKSAFFSNVSHEFRTPLTLILGATTGGPASPARPRPDDLQVVRRNARRLMKLVNTLLDFSQIEAQRVRPTYRPTDLAALTRDVASVFRSAIEHAGLEFVVDCPPLPQPVCVDREMWEKIVLNLVSNALKFTFTGTVAVRLRAAGPSVELTVCDTGVGIPARDVPRVFERFYRSADTRGRTHEGSGIGLALVRELVALHGGTSCVASELGAGSSFIVTIPMGASHLDPASVAADEPTDAAVDATPYVEEVAGWLAEPDATADEPEVAVSRATDSFHVLVADDNADMREYLRRLLRPRWSVEVVADGRDAMAAAKRRHPDLIIADVMMPRLDGIGLIRELRSDAATRAVPVILLTARASEQSQIQGWNAGADSYMVKPFAARELVARVEAEWAKATMRAAEARQARRIAALFADAPVGIATVRGPRHVFEFANPEYLRMLPNQSVIGRPLGEVVPELAAAGVLERLDAAFAAGSPWRGRGMRLTSHVPDAAAADERFFDFAYQPIVGDAGAVDGAVIVAHEVTELANARREAEASNALKDHALADLQSARADLECRVAARTAELTDANARLTTALCERAALERARSEWVQRLIAVQEDERRRVARELHDEIGQHLTALFLGLHRLGRTSDPRTHAIARLTSIVSSLEDGMRRLARALRPATLDDLGLVSALAHHTSEWSSQTGIPVEFVSRDLDTRLPAALELALYRIAQEALTNVARHAEARAASVVAERRGTDVILVVEDDGHGFDGQRSGCAEDAHFGLTNIRERAALLGGRVTIESTAAGTSLFVSLPLQMPTSGVTESSASPPTAQGDP